MYLLRHSSEKIGCRYDTGSSPYDMPGVLESVDPEDENYEVIAEPSHDYTALQLQQPKTYETPSPPPPRPADSGDYLKGISAQSSKTPVLPQPRPADSGDYLEAISSPASKAPVPPPPRPSDSEDYLELTPSVI